jgi:hypothetical protein
VKKLQFRVLYRQFLLRVVDLELLAPQGDITKLLGQFVALLAIVSLWILLPSVSMAARPSSPDLGLIYAWVEAHFLVSTTMLTVGLFAVLSWESMFPDRRDVLVLFPLPVRGRTLFLAKVAAVATALSLTLLALKLFPGPRRAARFRLRAGGAASALRPGDAAGERGEFASGAGSRSRACADSGERRAGA